MNTKYINLFIENNLYDLPNHPMTMSSNDIHLINDLDDASDIFLGQLWYDQYKIIQHYEDANYLICTWRWYKKYLDDKYKYRTENHRFNIIFETDEEFNSAIAELNISKPFKWVWKYDSNHPAYEVTSRGDRRFSPLAMMVKDGDKLISEEEYFHKYLKPYYVSGQTPPISGTDVMLNYLKMHRGLLYELALIGKDLPFSDMFDKNGGQNLLYVKALNKYFKDMYKS